MRRQIAEVTAFESGGECRGYQRPDRLHVSAIGPAANPIQFVSRQTWVGAVKTTPGCPLLNPKILPHTQSVPLERRANVWDPWPQLMAAQSRFVPIRTRLDWLGPWPVPS